MELLDDPVVYAARCPKCHGYNVVTEKGAPSEAEPPEPEAEPEAEPEEPAEPTEPETTEPVDK